MAEKLLANASSKLTLEEKQRWNGLPNLKARIPYLISSVLCVRKRFPEVEGEMAGKNSLEVIKTFALEKSQKLNLNISFSEMFLWVKR